jgi:hypothetical protein
MNKSKKIWIGFLSFLPLLLGIAALVYMFVGFLPTLIRMEEEGAADAMPLTVLSQMMPFVLLIVISALLHMGLLIYFIIHAVNNKHVKQEERIIWVLVFIFVSSIAFPVYWAIRIWPDPKPDSNFIKV